MKKVCLYCDGELDVDPTDARILYCLECGIADDPPEGDSAAAPREVRSADDSSALNAVHLAAARLVREELSDRGRAALGHLLRNAVYPLRLELERHPGDRDEAIVRGSFAHLLEVVAELTR